MTAGKFFLASAIEYCLNINRSVHLDVHNGNVRRRRCLSSGLTPATFPTKCRSWRGPRRRCQVLPPPRVPWPTYDASPAAVDGQIRKRPRCGIVEDLKVTLAAIVDVHG